MHQGRTGEGESEDNDYTLLISLGKKRRRELGRQLGKCLLRVRD